MTPEHLWDMCIEAVANIKGEEPFVRLVLTRAKAPKGRSVRLFGDCGPLGRLDIVREKPDGSFECVTCFKALPILRELRAVGVNG